MGQPQGKLLIEALYISQLADNLAELLKTDANEFLLQEITTKAYHLADIHARCKDARYKALLGPMAANTPKIWWY